MNPQVKPTHQQVDLLAASKTLQGQLPMEIQVSSIGTRIAINTDMIEILGEENKRLAGDWNQIKALTHSHQFESRWKEIKLKIESILRCVYRVISPTPPTMDQCQVHLRRTNTLQGSIWNWELIFPEEFGCGVHFKVFDLNSASFMPACCEENELFVRFLIDNRFIRQFILYSFN